MAGETRDFDAELEAYEVKAKRFGSVNVDLTVRPLNTGFSAFDRHMLMRAGQPDLCVIGARPGTGKTSFLVQVLRNIAKAGEGHTVMFSLEMAHEQLFKRALASELESPIDRLKALPPVAIEKARARINEEPFFVDATNGLEINQLRKRAMDYKRRYGLAAIGVDYVQIIRAEGGDKRAQVASAAVGLKQLAIDLSIPVIALAQMNREIERRQQQSKDAKPSMSDLQECSLLENWADQITFLVGAGKRDPSREGQIDAFVEKNRHGATGRFVLAFDGATTKFSDYEPDGL